MSSTPESPSPSPAPRKKSGASLRRSTQSLTSSDQDGDKSPIPFNHFPKPEIIRDIKELISSSDLSQKKMAQDLCISQTKVSQFLNNVPRTKGWGSFEEKVAIWLKEQRIKLGRVKKEGTEENPDQLELELSPISFSGESTPVSEVSNDNMAIQSPSPLFVMPFSSETQPANGFQLWIPYSNTYQVSSQVSNGMPTLTKSFSWPQPRRAHPYEGYYMTDSKSEYTPTPREIEWMTTQHKMMYPTNMYGNIERMDAEPTSVQENDWSTFSLNEVFEKKQNP